MSFFTALTFYRPTAPPAVTGGSLAQFIMQIRDSGTLTDSGLRVLQVKFGESVDQDDHGTSREEETAPGVYVAKDIDWDVDLFDSPSLEEIIQSLQSNDRPIYRARITLGQPIDEVLRPITRANSPENEVDYFPDALSLQIGPVECYSSASEQPLRVGWIAVDLSGYGYLFPWTLRDVVERAQASPEIQRLMGICRTFWPVRRERPEQRVVELRKRFPEIWPYDEYDREWDWYWGLAES